MAQNKTLRVVVIGAGLSGIITAIEFKKKLGIDVQIYERYAKPGGTWMVNVYPGCACDVPSHWYSLSTEIKRNWDSTYSNQPEIQAYWEGIFRKHKLEKRTRFGSTFVGAKWDNSRQLYVIDFHDSDDKSKIFQVEAEILVSAIGGFSTPLDKPPGLNGIERFHGPRFHSARWDYGVDLKDKKVAVIGNGCSAAQFVPKISQNATTHVLNFSRTPSWYAPRFNSPFTPSQKWMLVNIPGAAELYRNGLAFFLDSRWIAWIMTNKRVRKTVEAESLKYIEETAPKEYLDFLRPKYPFGCKRVIIDPGYLQCLHQPNVDLITDRISSVTEKGIQGASGTEYDFDVLILATGFDVSVGGSMGLNVTGSHGRTVAEQWHEQNGPQAYLGTTVANFPNFFMLLGPNVATGHTSVIAHIECQVHYICEIVKVMKANGVDAMDLKEEAEEEYNVWIQKELNKTAWVHCTSYYRLDNGKVIATWPGTVRKFWWMTLKPNFAHYRQQGGRLDVAQRQRNVKRLQLLAFALSIVAGVYLGGLHAIGARLLRFLRIRA